MKKITVWCISKYASPPQYGVGARLFYIVKEFSNMGLNVLLISDQEARREVSERLGHSREQITTIYLLP